MSRRTTIAMTVMVLAGIAVILLMNTASFFGFESGKYLYHNWIRGVAVEYNGLLYTLNFEQQNRLVDIVNQSVPIHSEDFVSKQSHKKEEIGVNRVIIYRFNAPDLDLKPVGFVNSSDGNKNGEAAMVFAVSKLSPTGMLKETSGGSLQNLFAETYDH